MLGRVIEVLEITADELKDAILKDHEMTLNNYLSQSQASSEDAQQSSTTSPSDESVHPTATPSFMIK